jgi:hypothetical protein
MPFPQIRVYFQDKNSRGQFSKDSAEMPLHLIEITSTATNETAAQVRAQQEQRGQEPANKKPRVDEVDSAGPPQRTSGRGLIPNKQVATEPEALLFCKKCKKINSKDRKGRWMLVQDGGDEWECERC